MVNNNNNNSRYCPNCTSTDTVAVLETVKRACCNCGCKWKEKADGSVVIKDQGVVCK